MKEYVSIVIPTYGENSDPCKAIESVFNQSYPYIEVIVVDDNGKGTDQQLYNEKRLEKYCKNPGFHYIVHDHNKGGSAARNTGAQLSSGKYINFLDDDDRFDIDKIKKQVECLQKLDASWGGAYSSTKTYHGDTYIRTNIAKHSGYVLEKYIKGKIRIGTPSLLVRREAFLSIGGYDPTFIRHQDWEFNSRLLDSYKLVAVPDAFYERHYKLTAQGYDLETRKSFMDKYTSSMLSEIKTLKKEKLETLLKRKYIAIVSTAIRRGELSFAKEVFKQQGYGIVEIIIMVKYGISYCIKRAFYGTHF